MNYLDPSEYATYATEFVLDDSHVAIASKLIESYCGRSFGSTQTTQHVVLNKKYSGKLKNCPIVSIDSAMSVARLASGKVSDVVDIDDIEVDSNGYFTYYGQVKGIYPGWGAPTPSQIFGVRQSYLEITYTYGYAEVPEDIKFACGMVAQNISQAKQFAGVKEISDFDGRIAMFDDSFLPSDIRMILNKYRMV